MATFKASFKTSDNFNATMSSNETLTASFGSVQKVSTGNYDDLANKPLINNRTVEGSKTGADYNLQDKMDAMTIQEIEKILYL